MADQCGWSEIHAWIAAHRKEAGALLATLGPPAPPGGLPAPPL